MASIGASIVDESRHQSLFRLPMMQPANLHEPAPKLTERARAAVRQAGRICQRSQSICEHSAVLKEVVSHTLERMAAARTRRERIRALARPTFVHSMAASVPALPLRSPMLRELADEFRQHADIAATPESRAAFIDLAHRYIALAAGFDIERMRSCRLH